ncbi:hypothetical protein HD806DRAFT_493488 [Xylariaceae sp. AK1471]|nr:hypothetical protein HD806DRAFT_493488 [Xylariaceae sp. AK1471]
MSWESPSLRHSSLPFAFPESQPRWLAPRLEAVGSCLTMDGNCRRRAHHKSRLGCKNCKIRKIKCDESKPACSNCIKREARCDFLDDNRPKHNPSPSGLNMSDLELLHNYTTMTCSTLSESHVIREFYKVSVVQVGLSHEYIMRAILAVSSLHLAHHRPEMREHYQSVAILHHQAASQMAMPLMPDISPESAQMLFLFSVLTTYYALGWPRKAEDSLLLEGSGLPVWVYLLRGVHGFIQVAGVPEEGPLSPLFKHSIERYNLREKADEATSLARVPLEELRALIAQRPLSDDLRQMYLTFIDELKKSFAKVYANTTPYELVDAFIWIFMTADKLLPLLQVPTQESVAIFAFFCVLLHILDNHWWIQGWGQHLMKRVYSLLDDECRLWVRWPLEEIGWIPPSTAASL